MIQEPRPHFVETLEYRRFAEFCEACVRHRYIGLCFGPPGVGKTLSARHQAAWDGYEYALSPNHVGDEQLPDLAARRTLFYTAPVVNTPRQIEGDLTSQRQRLRRFVEEPLRREEAARFAALNAEAERRQREFLVDGDWLSEAMPQHWAPPYADLAHEYRPAERVGRPDAAASRGRSGPADYGKPGAASRPLRPRPLRPGAHRHAGPGT